MFVAMRRYMAEGVDKGFKAIKRKHIECAHGVTAEKLMTEYAMKEAEAAKVIQ